MSTIKSSSEDLTLNADGSNEVKFQINAVEKASINSSGLFTSTTIDATALTGNLPAISGASLTGITTGKVLQVKQDTLSTTETISSTTWADLSNLSVSITPSATDSDILIMGHINAGNNTTGNAQFRLRRDSTDICIGSTASGSRVDATFSAFQSDTNSISNCSFAFVDVPGTTSAVQYHFQWRGSEAGAKYVNRSYNDNDAAYNLRGNSTIIVLEISGGLS